mmetsp:Transcript_72717/g.151912  ORF Transcript_72717/g.151912 Transcript_72717/m.151912 type:complete len:212 (-) Transcript_72717:688-1323(-)
MGSRGQTCRATRQRLPSSAPAPSPNPPQTPSPSSGRPRARKTWTHAGRRSGAQPRPSTIARRPLRRGGGCRCWGTSTRASASIAGVSCVVCMTSGCHGARTRMTCAAETLGSSTATHTRTTSCSSPLHPLAARRNLNLKTGPPLPVPGRWWGSWTSTWRSTRRASWTSGGARGQCRAQSSTRCYGKSTSTFWRCWRAAMPRRACRWSGSAR